MHLLKLLCILLMLILLIVPFSGGLASQTGSGSFTATIDGKTADCVFDPSEEYSNLKDGSYLASFYGYDADNTLYEFYLFIPATAQTGSAFSSNGSTAESPDCGILCLITRQDKTMIDAAASIASGAVYPEGSSFDLKLSNVSKTASGYSMSGTISATMAVYTQTAVTSETISLEGSFSFEIQTGASADTIAPSPSASSAPADPEYPYGMPDSTATPPEGPAQTPAPAVREKQPDNQVYKV